MSKMTPEKIGGLKGQSKKAVKKVVSSRWLSYVDSECPAKLGIMELSTFEAYHRNDKINLTIISIY